MATLKLKAPQKGSPVNDKPKLTTQDIQRNLSDEFNGLSVALRTANGKLVGSGIFNKKTRYIWRKFSNNVEEFNESYLRKAIKRAIDSRENRPVRRLVWSDADFIPGLIVDQFGDSLVVETSTLACENHLEAICTILNEIVKPHEIVVRNDGYDRKHENLDKYVQRFLGKPIAPSVVKYKGLKYEFDLVGGIGVDFNIDRFPYYAKIASYAKGRRVLDAFCFQGHIGMNCKAAGAAEVVCVDQSKGLLNKGEKIAKDNGLDISFVKDNVNNYLRNPENSKFGLITIDPDPIVRRNNDGEDLKAVRDTYEELNIRALKMLSNGGILATFCPLKDISKRDFQNILKSAAQKCGRQVRIRETLDQSHDFPIPLSQPKLEFVYGMILEIQ